MGRHRHVVNVRADGIAVVLGPLLRDPRIVAATLVDAGSGMVLDAWWAGPSGPAPSRAPDLELLGAQHAEVVRCGLALLGSGPWPAGPGDGTVEVVLGADGGCRHLLRTVPDPHGDRLVLAVVVDGPQRVLDRVRKRLRAVSVDALTAGPTMSRRPEPGGGSFAPPPPQPTPVPPAPPALPPRQLTAPPPARTSGRRPVPDTVERRPRPDVERPPSPPAALPAPAPPRPRSG